MAELKWNNGALLRFCDLMSLDYIDDAVVTIAKEVGTMGSTGRVSVKGARVLAAMFDAATGEGNGIEKIMDAEQVKALVSAFIKAMPRPSADDEKKKEASALPLQSLSDGVAATSDTA